MKYKRGHLWQVALKGEEPATAQLTVSHEETIMDIIKFRQKQQEYFEATNPI